MEMIIILFLGIWIISDIFIILELAYEQELIRILKVRKSALALILFIPFFSSFLIFKMLKGGI